MKQCRGVAGNLGAAGRWGWDERLSAGSGFGGAGTRRWLSIRVPALPPGGRPAPARPQVWERGAQSFWLGAVGGLKETCVVEQPLLLDS